MFSFLRLLIEFFSCQFASFAGVFLNCLRSIPGGDVRDTGKRMFPGAVNGRNGDRIARKTAPF
jgi:hypothetical protein